MRHPTPKFKHKPLAIAFTVGLHMLAIGALVYFGNTPLPPTPKPIKTILVTPAQLAEMENPQHMTEVPAEKQAETTEAPQIAETPEEINLNPPIIPPVPVSKPNQLNEQQIKDNQAKLEAKQNEQAEKAKAEADKRKAEQIKKDQAEADKRKAEQVKKDQAEADKRKAEQVKKDQADADKRKAEQAKKDQADADKRKAEQAKKDQADADKRKAEQAKKDQANADKRKAEQAKKDQADADKRKAEQAKKDQADADKRKAEQTAKAEKEAKEAAGNKKAEARKIASTAKRDFEAKIRSAWQVPIGSTGTKATARVTLTDSGGVASVIVTSSDANVKASVEAAIRAAAPYPMPDDPEARRQARSFTSTFTAK